MNSRFQTGNVGGPSHSILMKPWNLATLALERWNPSERQQASDPREEPGRDTWYGRVDQMPFNVFRQLCLQSLVCINLRGTLT